MSDDLKLAEHTVEVACALIDRLQVENQRLRAENERLRNKKSARPDAQFESATDPAPAVCEWGVTAWDWYKGACNENCKWRLRSYECPSFGESIKFTEAKE